MTNLNTRLSKLEAAAADRPCPECNRVIVQPACGTCHQPLAAEAQDTASEIRREIARIRATYPAETVELIFSDLPPAITQYL